MYNMETTENMTDVIVGAVLTQEGETVEEAKNA